MPGKRNFASFQQGNTNSTTTTTTTTNMGGSTLNRSNKKLRRLPHVFSKVLELPFTSEADVHVEDNHDCLKFIAKINGWVFGCGIHVIEVHPGITKVVVRQRESRSKMVVDELELDVWRFRLPATARLELATAVLASGKLVVTVPKEKIGKEDECKRGFKGNIRVVVQ